MKKYLLIFLSMFIMTGCFEPDYKEEASVSKYVMDDYKSVLEDNKIAELKCSPIKDGYIVYYFTAKKPNDFPATILLEGINGTYNVYFDAEYRLLPKEKLIKDIDSCFKELDRIIKVDKSWQ